MAGPTTFRAPLDTCPGGTSMWLAASCQWADPWDMSMSQIEIRDIAMSLSNICRYNGHVANPLTVAEHSVAVMVKLKSMTEKGKDYTPDANDLLAALLHDAPEAYLGDIHGPSKKKPEFAFYREAEDRLMELIYARFGIYVDDELAERIHAADMAVFRDEWETPGGQFSPRPAERLFLHRYHFLQRELLFKR
jgi:hypothetical protein